MLKQFFYSFVLASVLLVPGLSVRAAGTATMTLDAPSYEVERGDLFDVVVSVDPGGEALDTVRAVVTFDPTRLSAQNVRLTGSFDRSAPGNYRDNTNGKVSWGAFTIDGPVTAVSDVVTITFLALASGEGTIQLSSDSRAISDGEERIDISQLGESEVSIAEASESEPGVAVLAVESSSHPQDGGWYANTQVELSWTELEGESPVSAYYYSFSLTADEEPSVYLSGSTTELSLEAPQDGLYYFRLKGVQEDGKETSIAQRVVGVDTTAPNAIELSVQDDKILEGESAWFTFATTDETSGVLQYQVAINDSEFQVQASPLEMEDLPVGTYFFRVAALDRAGNAIYSGVSVRVYPEGTDLDRPEDYETTGEVQTIATSLQTAAEEISGNKTLLITVVLGVVALFGIIYLSRKRKS